MCYILGRILQTVCKNLNVGEKLNSTVLHRLVALVGHIALCQLNYLDVSVMGELKRRKTLRDKAMEMNKSAKQKKAAAALLVI